MAFPTGWGRKVKITIPDAQIAGSNTDFSVLLTEGEFPTEMLDGGANSALNGGGDVRFSEDAAGSTRLDLDIVTFVTGGTPDVELWVKMPTLNTGAAKEFYAWYKKAAETQPAVNAAFGRNAVWADYEFVLHLNGVTTDSTGNNTPSEIGTLGTRTGPLGGDVYDFSGTNQGIDLGSATGDTVGDFTLQAWARPDIILALATIIARRDGANWNYQWRLELLDPSILIGTASPNDPGPDITGIWNKLDLTVFGTTIEYYQAGASTGTQTVTGTRSLQSGINTTIGITVDLIHEFDGGIAETRVRFSILSDDWITTEFNNQNAPATFASAGTPEAVNGAPTTRRYSLSLTGVG